MIRINLDGGFWQWVGSCVAFGDSDIHLLVRISLWLARVVRRAAFDFCRCAGVFACSLFCMFLLAGAFWWVCHILLSFCFAPSARGHCKLRLLVLVGCMTWPLESHVMVMLGVVGSRCAYLGTFFLFLGLDGWMGFICLLSLSSLL